MNLEPGTTHMEQIYVYMSGYSGGRAEHPICLGRRPFVERFIPLQEIGGLFGGYLLCADASEVEYLGVWSHRICQRFRRILRERGAQFEVSTKPPKLRLKMLVG